MQVSHSNIIIIIVESKKYVDQCYVKWLRKFGEKIEREKRIKEKREAEEKARKQPTQASSATVKEITPEEYERRQKESANKDKKPQEPAKAPAPASKDKKEDDEDKLQEGHVMPNKEKGADKEKYSWGQMDIKEITITVPVPSNIRGRDIDIKYDNNHLYCAIKGQEPIINSDFYQPIKSDTFVWTLEEVRDKKVLVMTFEKGNNSTWWESVEKNDTVKVDTRKVQPEASRISDIEDPELKAQVEKMMFDTRQKAMGKPTSDILQKAPQIEQFMAQHPELDFSKATFNC